MSYYQTTVMTARHLLQNGGVRLALRYLNSRTPHRFTAIFRFEEGTLRNLHLIDRLDPKVERCPDLPVLESYCLFVRDSGCIFLTEDALHDTRVAGHPKQRVVQSYCGVPLFDGDDLFGTICHFDYRSIPFSKEDVWVLEEVAPMLIRAIRAGEWVPDRAAFTEGGGLMDRGTV
ncbi:GAF domain-containing protein [Thermithiobacillus plumbiphilus]|uniref:GAF domain-containing protein n=1 Tax=Thermithiobacillus plumbiphilus TaxID=1729899 RepID=A0ABU9D746_9PROT